MSQVDLHRNTLPQPSRRELFGSGAALLLLASGGAGDAKAAELDGELLAACAEYHAYAAERVALEDRNCEWAEVEASGERGSQLLQQVYALPAKTPEGAAAKAAVLRAELSFPRGTEIKSGWAEPDIMLAWSLVNDLVVGRD